MKDISIQYPDGRFHTVSVYRFYSVMYNGKEEYVIEYDDLTDNVRGCFSILDKENNIFVKKPLADSAAYRLFYNSIKFMYKKQQAIYLLPNTINLCRSALEALVPFAPPINADNKPVKTQTKRQIIVFRDISKNSDDYPYYMDKVTAKEFGFMCNGPYYHLNLSLMESLRRVFDIVVQNRELNLVVENNIGKKPADQVAEGNSLLSPSDPGRNPEEVVVYEDISPKREEFPFYLSQYDAKRFGLKIDEKKAYYHLKKVEFDVINRYAIIKLEKKELVILPQKNRRNVSNLKPTKLTETSKIVQLNTKELETLETLFDGLMDFEDYYSFFGIEELRDATMIQVFNSPRMIALTNLFNKGVECNNDLAINLLEFVDGFKKELLEKGKKF